MLYAFRQCHLLKSTCVQYEFYTYVLWKARQKRDLLKREDQMFKFHVLKFVKIHLSHWLSNTAKA